jgi:uncharacterized protein
MVPTAPTSQAAGRVELRQAETFAILRVSGRSSWIAHHSDRLRVPAKYSPYGARAESRVEEETYDMLADQVTSAPHMSADLASRLTLLRRLLSDLDSTVVAFSGGVDSSLLAAVAVEQLGNGAVLCTAVSPSMAQSELAGAKTIAAFLGARLQVVETDEVGRDEYARNAPNRCYVCRGVVFEQIWRLAQEEGIGSVVYGANPDDGDDFRPGGRAAVQAGVRAPLVEVGIKKADVRQLARALGLPNWDKPSAPCLASRIPYGQRVTIAKLEQVEAAEAILHRLGFRECRVRHHVDVARVELPAADLAFAIQPQIRKRIVEGIVGLGFHYVALDLEGFRSGSLNEPLNLKRRPRHDRPASIGSHPRPRPRDLVVLD